jgi:hypothetical protein
MMTGTTQCQLANTEETLTEVYRLRYACYRRKRSIGEREDEQFRDSFDDQPNSFSFLVRNEREALATVRITVVKPDIGWTDSPVRHVYGDHEAFQAIARESYVEASRLCFGRQARRDAFVGLVGHMAALADLYRVEWLAACPRVEHAAVYQRMFGFQPLAAPRQYFGVSFETQLLGIRVSEIRNYVQDEKTMTGAWSNALARVAGALAVPVGSWLEPPLSHC